MQFSWSGCSSVFTEVVKHSGCSKEHVPTFVTLCPTHLYSRIWRPLTARCRLVIAGWWSLSREMVLASHGSPEFAAALDNFAPLNTIPSGWHTHTHKLHTDRPCYIPCHDKYSSDCKDICLHVSKQIQWSGQCQHGNIGTVGCKHVDKDCKRATTVLFQGLLGEGRAQRVDADQAEPWNCSSWFTNWNLLAVKQIKIKQKRTSWKRNTSPLEDRFTLQQGGSAGSTP